MRTVGRGARRTDFAIIERASGIIRPGVFTLLLGPPGSGKSTFLKALAGQHTKGSHIRVGGWLGGRAGGWVGVSICKMVNCHLHDMSGPAGWGQAGVTVPGGGLTGISGLLWFRGAIQSGVCDCSVQIHADELSYNGLAFNQFHVARSAAYISQVQQPQA